MRALAFAAVALLLQEAPPAWTPIEATTYEQRQAAHPLAGPRAEAVLALPFGAQAESWPPRLLAAGEAVGLADPWRVVARVLPRQPVHEEYLAKRAELAKDPLALVTWCRKNRLDACAELEASRRMDEIEDFQKPEYAKFLQPWLEIRDQEQVAFCFPLPLEGEWFVLEDTTRHHRKKAFAAYAFDIMKRVDGKPFRGKGTQLEEFFGYGEPIVAQADGVVVSVDDGFPDHAPRALGDFDDANDVIVDYGGGVLADYAHCRQGSAKVKAGDRVVRGTPLAEIGNSGATAVPHLHFTLLDWSYDSIRGRFRGEQRDEKEGSRWSAFDGRDLEPGKYVRNVPPAR